jgi:hypothetical protein
MIDLLIFLAGWVLLAGWFWLDTKPWKKLPGLFSYPDWGPSWTPERIEQHVGTRCRDGLSNPRNEGTGRRSTATVGPTG